MSEHDFTSQKVIHPDEDSNPATPPLPQDSGSASSNTSISTDLPLSQDVGSQSSERVSISAATPGVVRSPVPEAAVSTDPPVKGDTRSLSSSDYVSAVTATLSPEDSKHPQETELSPWLAWYLQKDIEWRKRLQEQCESRSRRLLQLEMSVQLKAKQKAEAERVFRSWCKMKTEERREAVFEKQRRQMDLEADKLRKKQRLREQSKHKYREWLETKKEQVSRKSEEKTDDNGNESLEKTLATERAFTSWLKRKKGSKCTSGTFHVRNIDGQLVGFWE